MKPIEALEKAIERGCLGPYESCLPGAIILRCPKVVRDALEQLTSDEALQMRYLDYPEGGYLPRKPAR